MKTRLLVGLALLVASACLSPAGTVLVYRNNGWRIADWKYRFGHETPAVPEACQKIWTRLGLDGSVDDQRLPDAATWGGYPGGLPVEKGEGLFPRKSA